MLKNRIALLALASACSGLAVFGCSAEGPAPTENEAEFQKIDFNLSVDGATVSTVNYEVKNSSGATVKSGSFDVPLAESSFSVQLLLPVGTDYTLTVSGNGTKDGRTTPCLGSTEFDVVAGSNPPVELTVVCTDTIPGGNTSPVTGEVRADIDFVLETVIEPGEECGFTSGLVGPLRQAVGSSIALQSAYVPASAETSWASSNAAVGTIANASDDNTTFTCVSGGTTIISSSLTSGTCTDTFSVSVECVGAVAPTCGNGVIDSGETCDTCAADVLAVNGPTACDPVELCGNGVIDSGETCDTCEADVLAVNGPTACDEPPPPPVCGNGTLEGTEECDDNNTVSNDGCSATCVVEFCGDGIVQSSEQCDDGNNAAGDGCSATCTIEIAGPVCGNGIDEEGEDCTTCPADQPAGSCDPAGATCGDCLKSDPVSISYGIDAYVSSLCDTDPTCLAFQACVAESGCYRAPLTNQVCYCGFDAVNGVSSPTGTTPVPVTDCIAPAFQANGPCASILRNGLGNDSPTNQQVIERQFDTQYSAGVGFFLIATASDLGICQEECAY